MIRECRTRLISTTIIMGKKVSLERLPLKRILNLFSCDSLKILLQHLRKRCSLAAYHKFIIYKYINL